MKKQTESGVQGRFYKVLNEAVKRYGVTLNAIEDDLDLPSKTLRQVYNNERDPKLSTIERLCDGLGIEISFTLRKGWKRPPAMRRHREASPDAARS